MLCAAAGTFWPLFYAAFGELAVFPTGNLLSSVMPNYLRHACIPRQPCIHTAAYYAIDCRLLLSITTVT